MVEINFKSYKVTKKINLFPVKNFFALSEAFLRYGYLILEKDNLKDILSINSEHQRVYIFESGNLVFIDFTENQIYDFLKYLDSIINSIDYSLYTTFNDSYSIGLLSENLINLWDDRNFYITEIPSILHIISIVLSKSLDIRFLDDKVGDLLDACEQFINNLQSGKINIKQKLFIHINTQLLKLQYSTITSLGIYDKALHNWDSSEVIDLYNKFAKYYEIYEKNAIVSDKIHDAKKIIKSYSSSYYEKQTTRIYLLEILFIGFFPVEGILNYFFHFH
jgi:uncharacterized Rmd1/YagE family protein